MDSNVAQPAFLPKTRLVSAARDVQVESEHLGKDPRVESHAASGDRASQPGGGVLRAAFTSAEALSGEDCVRWHLLASHRPESAPLVDAAWMLSWADAFAPPEPVLLGAWEAGQLVGLAALQRVRESCGGRRLAVLQSLTNVESYRFDFLAWEGRADITDRLWRALFEARRWDLIHLEHIPQGSSTLSAGLAVARERGWRAVVEPTFLTPWRPLSRAEPWDEGLKRKFKSNLRNRERRLASLGEVSFEVVTGQGALRKALDVFYDLEAGGWKGQGGTAVARRQQVKRLYDRLLERAGEDMRIPILAVSGRPVAAQVLRVRGKIMFMLKTAYDEAYSAYAPGQLLTARVLQYGREDGLEALDFLADNADWKADWAPRFLQHDRLLLFAPSLPGRYAYWVRYGLREQAKRVPGLVGLIRWLRGRRSEAA